MSETSETPVIDQSGAAAQVDQAHQRLLWTGAAANGALILALIGFAGNGNDKMAALRMITTPVMIGIVGFSFGGVAIIHGSARLAERLFEPAARAKITMANQMLGSFREVLTTPPMDANFARLVWGDQADQKMRELLRDRLKAARAATDKSPVMFEEAMQALNDSAARGVVHLRAARRWLCASFVAAALAVVALLFQAWAAKPAATAAPAVGPVAGPVVVPKANPPAAPAALPACPGGAQTCRPWERNWKVPPALGTVATAHNAPLSK